MQSDIMKATVYIFGNFADGYSQYPDNYTHDLFNTIASLRKGATELVFHREGALTYYIYTRDISHVDNTFIGLCYVFNDIIITNFSCLFDTFENAITDIAVKGELLEFTNDGDLSTKIHQLYTNEGELQRISDYLNSKLSSLGKYAMKVPPINYGVSNKVWKEFPFDKNAVAQQAQKDYYNIRVVKGENYNAKSLNTFASKLKTQNDEIKILKKHIYQKNEKIIELENRLGSKTRNALIPHETKSKVDNEEHVFQDNPISHSAASQGHIDDVSIKRVKSITVFITCMIIAACGCVYFWNTYKNKKMTDYQYRQQIEAEYKAVRDSCDFHFMQGQYAECSEDIRKMKELETKYKWLKLFSEVYQQEYNKRVNDIYEQINIRFREYFEKKEWEKIEESIQEMKCLEGKNRWPDTCSSRQQKFLDKLRNQ